MIDQSNCFLLSVVVMVMASGICSGLRHTVGDTIWSIPPFVDFYNDWSSSRIFHVGDSLLFNFEGEFHNVMQVSTREYRSCTGDSPFREFMMGPANVPLMEEGVFYFICSVSDYCALGQKVAVTVSRRSATSYSPTPSSDPPSPSPLLIPSSDPPSPTSMLISSSHPPSPPSGVPSPADVGFSSRAPAVQAYVKIIEIFLTWLLHYIW